MKFSSKSALILCVTFALVALIWFLWNKSPAAGIIWLCAASVEFVIFLICRKKERKQ